MAEIRTTRMRLVQWTEGTDSPQRVDFNETFGNIESLAAIDQQGPISNRPTPNKTGMYYFAMDEGILYRSDGLSWAVVGASTLSHLVRSARADSVALTVQAIAGQTADLQRVNAANGTTYVRVRSNGDLLVGPLRISQTARTTTASDAAPTDSAVTVDNNSSTMWNTTAKNTTGNTAGYYRAVRGTSTVFSVNPDGSISTPAVSLTEPPSADAHAVRRTDLLSAINNARYDINSENITGTLSVGRGGTGQTSHTAGSYLVGAGTSGVTSKTPAQVRSDIDAAISSHGHDLADANLTGVLAVSQGGTGATNITTARSALGVPSIITTISAGVGLTGGGNLTTNRTFQVVFEGSGTKDTVARSDHGHDITDANITGVLPVAQGGTGRATLTAGSYLQGNDAGLPNLRTPAQVLSDIGAAPSVHGHALTDANLTGILPVAQGGTGASTAAAGLANLGAMPRNVENLPADHNLNDWTTSGVFTTTNSNQSTVARGYPAQAAGTVTFFEHYQTRSNYATQILTSQTGSQQWRRSMRAGTWDAWEKIARSPFAISEGISASGWDSQSGGQVVTPLEDGRFGVSLGVRLVRTGSTFTQDFNMTTHGYVSTVYRPTQGASLFPCFIGGTLGMAQINWANAQFSARTLTGTVSMSAGTFIEFSYSWVSNGP